MLMRRGDTSQWFGPVEEDFPVRVEEGATRIEVSRATGINEDGLVTAAQRDVLRAWDAVTPLAAESEITLIMMPGCKHITCARVCFQLSLN